MSNLGSLLAWGIENSAPASSSNPRQTELDPTLVAQLFGQNTKSDATLMLEAMAAIQDPTLDLVNKEIAFDNLELLIEQLDNANNLHNLGLWPPLVELLSHPEPRLRFMAAWCCGTAVQNNRSSQEAFVGHGEGEGVRRLVKMVWDDGERENRRKAVYAISSAVRNCQRALEVAVEALPEEWRKKREGVVAEDMDAVDELVRELRVWAAREVEAERQEEVREKEEEARKEEEAKKEERKST